MGSAKALMMEMEEAEWEETGVSFNCPECKFEVDGTVEVPVVYEYGDQHHLPVVVACNGCPEKFDGWVKTDWDNCEIELDDYPEVQIEAIPARGSISEDDDYDHEYYEWLEQPERPSRPIYQAFYKTMGEVKLLSGRVLSDPPSQMLARMLLIQSITALETFLADTLIFTVANNKDAQGKLLRSSVTQIGEKNFKLTEAIGIENFAEVQLLAHLRNVSFHKLNKVKNLFQVGLGINILPTDEEARQLEVAIKKRHDCVHRNGMDGQSGEVHQIDQASLLSLAEILQQMVKSVDRKVETFESPF